ncbi:hypothetical protein H6F43_07045 [Leptolyngbya sp. FACHB-36]|uniref:hypothetical protein n=1 Tax=Leptolyngbya sp. FACHB-36 TaxID=2692808 RepID=UPI0016802764|nr:hypothetical protein [Leptolyngbya sp. FACHB-36]MBD2019943.1 hypothetical protein [Leptolyngbya sp. FACHB-36]
MKMLSPTRIGQKINHLLEAKAGNLRKNYFVFHVNPAVEISLMAVLLTCFLLLNLTTASIFPSAWQDEVMFVDPAVNLYLGKGFTSSAWPTISRNELWAGYPPLYPFLLSLWMRFFGFSLAAVRSLNYILITGAAAVLWIAVIRLGLVTSARGRFVLITLLLSGYGISFCYRSARPDCLAIFLITIAIFSYSIQVSYIRRICLTCLSILLLLTGLYLVIYVLVAGCLGIIYLKKSFFKEFLCLVIGLFIGAVILYSFYSFHDSWTSFITSVDYEKSNLEQSLFKNKVPYDPSLIAAISLIIGAFVYYLRKKGPCSNSKISFGVVASIFIPGLFYALGKFPTYYGWMLYLPLIICLSSVLLDGKKIGLRSLFTLVFVCLVGLPLFLTASSLSMNGKNYEAMELLAERTVKSEDWAYCNFGSYFVVKKRADEVFLPSHLPALSDSDRDRISVLFIQPDGLKKAKAALGGQWYDSGEGMKPRRNAALNFGPLALDEYNLRVFRRTQKASL